MACSLCCLTHASHVHIPACCAEFYLWADDGASCTAACDAGYGGYTSQCSTLGMVNITDQASFLAAGNSALNYDAAKHACKDNACAMGGDPVCPLMQRFADGTKTCAKSYNPPAVTCEGVLD